MELATPKYSVDALTLKWIAIVTMFIDHTGHVCYKWLGWSDTYLLLRYIGRTAFPIFVFLLLEGFRYTRNRWAYLRNLFLFALISEIPFDLALTGWEKRWTSQNIFWTLFLGLSGVMAAELLFRECEKRDIPRPVSLLIAALPLAAAVCAGQWISVDYHFWGVLIIALVYCGETAAPYLFGGQATPQLSRNIGAACAVVLWAILYDVAHEWINEVYGLVSLVLILCYNGERGHYRLSKWFFYGFYPAHLLILFLCRDTVFKWLLAG